MKKHGHIFEKFSSQDNLHLAYINARRGKSWQSRVRAVDRNAVSMLEELPFTATIVKRQIADGRSYYTFS